MDNLRKGVVSVVVSGVKAVRSEGLEVAMEMGQQLPKILAENKQFKCAIEVQKANEEEICRWSGMGAALVDLTVNGYLLWLD